MTHLKRAETTMEQRLNKLILAYVQETGVCIEVDSSAYHMLRIMVNAAYKAGTQSEVTRWAEEAERRAKEYDEWDARLGHVLHELARDMKAGGK